MKHTNLKVELSDHKTNELILFSNQATEIINSIKTIKKDYYEF